MSIITKSIPFASLFSENVLKEESLATELLTTDPSKKSIQKTCKNLHGATSSLEEGFGILPLGGPATLPTKPFGRVHAPASRSRTPAKEPELPIQGIYGPTFTDLLPPPNQVSSLVNRLVLNLGMIGSTESPLTWKVKTTNAKRSIYRLVPSTRPTREIDYIGSLDYWGTPMKGFGDGGFRPDGKYGMSLLPNQVKQMWPTPTAEDSGSQMTTGLKVRTAYGQNMNGELEKTEMKLWATPRSCSAMSANITKEAIENLHKSSPKFGNDGYWNDYEWRTGKDGKSRRVKPGIRLLVNGIQRRVDKLHIGGNAIVVPLATEFIKAFLESREGEVSV